jgi:hypothetical protein
MLPITSYILAAVLIASPVAAQEAEQPLNVQLTNAAWDAYKKGDFGGAIASADKCIQKFKAGADKEQKELGAKSPPTGAVSDEEKAVIFTHGVLNDVATCYWIKGSSAQKLHNTHVAKEAFTAVTMYPSARTWDPKGWFWSPAEDASNRLQDLK